MQTQTIRSGGCLRDRGSVAPSDSAREEAGPATRTARTHSEHPCNAPQESAEAEGASPVCGPPREPTSEPVGSSWGPSGHTETEWQTELRCTLRRVVSLFPHFAIRSMKRLSITRDFIRLLALFMNAFLMRVMLASAPIFSNSSVSSILVSARTMYCSV